MRDLLPHLPAVRAEHRRRPAAAAVASTGRRAASRARALSSSSSAASTLSSFSASSRSACVVRSAASSLRPASSRSSERSASSTITSAEATPRSSYIVPARSNQASPAGTSPRRPSRKPRLCAARAASRRGQGRWRCPAPGEQPDTQVHVAGVPLEDAQVREHPHLQHRVGAAGRAVERPGVEHPCGLQVTASLQDQRLLLVQSRQVVRGQIWPGPADLGESRVEVAVVGQGEREPHPRGCHALGSRRGCPRRSPARTTAGTAPGGRSHGWLEPSTHCATVRASASRPGRARISSARAAAAAGSAWTRSAAASASTTSWRSLTRPR